MFRNPNSPGHGIQGSLPNSKNKTASRENVYEIWIEAFDLIKRRHRDFVLVF